MFLARNAWFTWMTSWAMEALLRQLIVSAEDSNGSFKAPPRQMKRELELLVHKIGSEGISMLVEKVQAVKDWQKLFLDPRL